MCVAMGKGGLEGAAVGGRGQKGEGGNLRVCVCGDVGGGRCLISSTVASQKCAKKFFASYVHVASRAREAHKIISIHLSRGLWVSS